MENQNNDQRNIQILSWLNDRLSNLHTRFMKFIAGAKEEASHEADQQTIKNLEAQLKESDLTQSDEEEK